MSFATRMISRSAVMFFNIYGPVPMGFCTNSNPFLTTLKDMRDIYTMRLSAHEYVPRLDLKKAVALSAQLAGRRSDVKEE